MGRASFRKKGRDFPGLRIGISYNSHLTILGEALGYPVKSNGNCHGIAVTGLNAFLIGNVKRFEEAYVSASKIEINDIVDEFRFKMRRVKRGNRKDRQFLNTLSLIENVTVNQYYDVNLDLFPKDTQFTSQIAYFDHSVNLINSKHRVSKVCAVNNIYDRNTLLKSVSKFQESCESLQWPVGFMCGNIRHSISCGYDPKSKVWFLLDANQAPHLRKVTLEQVRDYIWNGLNINSNPLCQLHFQVHCVEQRKERTLNALNDWISSQALIHSKDLVLSDKVLAGHLLWDACRNGHFDVVRDLHSYPEIIQELNNEAVMKIRECWPLGIAVKSGQDEVVAFMLDFEEWIIAPNIYIHAMIQMNLLKSLESLLKRYPKVQQADAQGKFPIHHAVEKRSHQMINILCKYGADVNSLDANGETPLFYAVRNNDMITLCRLLDRNPRIDLENKMNKSALYLALELNHIGIGLALTNNLKYNCPNYQSLLNSWLVQAIDDNNPSVVRYMLTCGADINHYDSDGFVPLHHAVCLNLVGVVRVLLSHGAYVESPMMNLNHEYAYKSTPLHIAAHEGGEEVIRLLIQHGANVFSKDFNKNTPLEVAEQWEDHDEAVKCLKIEMEYRNQENTEPDPDYLRRAKRLLRWTVPENERDSLSERNYPISFNSSQ